MYNKSNMHVLNQRLETFVNELNTNEYSYSKKKEILAEIKRLLKLKEKLML